MRQIVLDTETTGLEPGEGHRIIEIGCVEIVDRRLTGRHFHVYINPERKVDIGALEVHGLSDEFLADKPLFRDVADAFIDFIREGELIIHNAAFDVGFLDHELKLLQAHGCIADHCGVVDTLLMARKKHPGQRNSLDALCKRYGVDNSQRELHGALLDAEILADVYLLMTGGQTSLGLYGDDEGTESESSQRWILPAERPRLAVVAASAAELEAHETRLSALEKPDSPALWRSLQW